MILIDPIKVGSSLHLVLMDYPEAEIIINMILASLNISI